MAAHSLYEQSDPFTMQEPDGTLDLTHARAAGGLWMTVARWQQRVRHGATVTHLTIKLEGARKIGERA